jgi:hypothetical protein
VTRSPSFDGQHPPADPVTPACACSAAVLSILCFRPEGAKTRGPRTRRFVAQCPKQPPRRRVRPAADISQEPLFKAPATSTRSLSTRTRRVMGKSPWSVSNRLPSIPSPFLLGKFPPRCLPVAGRPSKRRLPEMKPERVGCLHSQGTRATPGFPPSARSPSLACRGPARSIRFLIGETPSARPSQKPATPHEVCHHAPFQFPRPLPSMPGHPDSDSDVRTVGMSSPCVRVP